MNKTTEELAIKALEMIAGERMCINNLLSDKDIAREALAAIRGVLADHVEQNLTMVADHSGDANEMVAPEGYALISIDALKAWGKYDEVRSACRFPAEPMNRPQNCGTGYCSCIECPYEPVKQEPVAIYMGHRLTPEGTKEFWGYADNALPEKTKLYAAPVQPVKQEPVAESASYCVGNIHWIVPPLKDGTPLYAAPVRTKDLTDDEIEDAVGYSMTKAGLVDCRAAIAKATGSQS